MKNWKFRLTKKAKKQFERLGSEVQKRIKKRCEVISKLDDPRDFDKSLQGNLSKYWNNIENGEKVCKIQPHTK